MECCGHAEIVYTFQLIEKKRRIKESPWHSVARLSAQLSYCHDIVLQCDTVYWELSVEKSFANHFLWHSSPENFRNSFVFRFRILRQTGVTF